MAHVYKPSMGDEAVKERTGRTWRQWFAALDRWGAAEKGHKATAAWLQDRHGLEGWWAQTVTVEYERARGMRKVGQRTSGDFEVTMQRTVAVSSTVAMSAWKDARRRNAWLTPALLKRPLQAGLREARWSRTAIGPVLRLSAGDGQKLDVTFTPKGRRKTAVRVQHAGLTSRAACGKVKAAWSTALDGMTDSIERS